MTNALLELLSELKNSRYSGCIYLFLKRGLLIYFAGYITISMPAKPLGHWRGMNPLNYYPIGASFNAILFMAIAWTVFGSV